MANTSLNTAKAVKDDEFYTLLKDIEKQMQMFLDYNPDVFKDKVVLCPCDDPTWSNFTRYFLTNFKILRLKKLISTCISPHAVTLPHSNLFEPCDAPQPYVEMRGKKLIVTADTIDDIDIDDVRFDYLEGSGDFSTAEITAFRDEADYIITNPPFSLFRAFFTWCMEGKKQFCILGTVNAISYLCVFPHIKDRSVRLGSATRGGGVEFKVKYSKTNKNRIDADGNIFVKLGSIRWFTNIEDGFTPPFIELKTMQENIESNTKLKGCEAYRKYDDSDVIEVPYTDAIPSDYDGVMGVPVTFFDKWNPEQFEMLSNDKEEVSIDGRFLYARFFIRRIG